MKRKLCAAVCACLLLAGCGTAAPTQNTEQSAAIQATASEANPVVETTTPQTVPETTATLAPKNPTLSETVVYEDDDFKLTAKELDFSNNAQLKIKFLAENNSDKNVVFFGQNFTINGITLSGYMYVKVAAGKKTNDYATFQWDDLATAGITEIATIVAQDAHISDTDSYETIVETPFKLETSIANDYIQEIDKSGQTIIEKDGIVVKYRGVSKTWTDIEKLDFYVENSGDQSVNVMVKDVSVNGFTIYGNMVARAYPNCSTYDSVTFLSDDFKTNDIKSIDEIAIRLYACDSTTYRTLWTSDEIKLARMPIEIARDDEADADSMPPDSVLSAVEAATGGVYNDFAIKNDDGNVLITCTFPGMGKAAPLLQAGNAELLANWNPFVESYQKACDAVRDYLKNVGYDVPVKWVLLNDEDTSKSLLEIVDGEVIYDVAKDGK